MILKNIFSHLVNDHLVLLIIQFSDIEGVGA